MAGSEPANSWVSRLRFTQRSVQYVCVQCLAGVWRRLQAGWKVLWRMASVFLEGAPHSISDVEKLFGSLVLVSKWCFMFPRDTQEATALWLASSSWLLQMLFLTSFFNCDMNEYRDTKCRMQKWEKYTQKTKHQNLELIGEYTVFQEQISRRTRGEFVCEVRVWVRHLRYLWVRRKSQELPRQ